jgi:hypothetical protein
MVDGAATPLLDASYDAMSDRLIVSPGAKVIELPTLTTVTLTLKP